MEYLIDTFNSEFKNIKEESFLTSFSLLSSIIFYSKNSRLDFNLLDIRISKHHSFEQIKCQYYSKSFPENNDYIKLNEELTLAQLTNFIRQGMIQKIDKGNGLSKDSFASQIDISRNLIFFVSLDKSNTHLILNFLLQNLNKLNKDLADLREKFKFIKDKISRYNSSSNLVKGSAYIYELKNYFITLEKKQMFELLEVCSYSNDTDSYNYFNLEADKLMNAIESDDNSVFFQLIE